MADHDTVRVASAPSPVGDLESPLVELDLAERYALEQPLGEGGMGRVLLYKDAQIGRRVAFKVMRPERAADDASRARFLREARIQAQLEHPAIVPVYDLGVDSSGAIYFTMKRIRGVTLRDVIDALRAKDGEAIERFTRRKLLTAFGSACLAIELAHERGVLHRDLKPENVMLGDFGELYVLDWGVAKLLGGVEDRPSSLGVNVPSALASTRGSAVLGTPGYMAPEQIRNDALGPACDVYALGAILFELLALDALHPEPTSEERVAGTLAGADARASVRAPDRDVAPELDAICVRATSSRPEDRFTSARDLNGAIERFLDGERDVELRQSMAAVHARLAEDAASRAHASLDDRREAMRQVGRALALDPDNHAAAMTMSRMLTEAPRELPREVEDDMERSIMRHRRWMGRVGTITYASVLLYVPLLMWPGVRSWTAVVGFLVPMLAACGVSFYQSRQQEPRDGPVMLSLVLSNTAFAIASVFYGPLVIVPAAIALNATAYAVHMQRRRRVVAVAIGIVAFLVPFALEVSGVLGRSYGFVNGTMAILPRGVELPQTATLVVLGLSGVLGIATGAIAVSHVRDALAEAERSLYLYAWHLRELVPDTARRATADRTKPRPPRPPASTDDRATRPMAKYS